MSGFTDNDIPIHKLQGRLCVVCPPAHLLQFSHNPLCGKMTQLPDISTLLAPQTSTPFLSCSLTNKFSLQWTNFTTTTCPQTSKLRRNLISGELTSLCFYFGSKYGTHPVYQVWFIPLKSFGDSGLLEKTFGWHFFQIATTLEWDPPKKSIQVEWNQKL